jgi:DNA-directed RNA polymerase I, II, and III subunit RPABC1
MLITRGYSLKQVLNAEQFEKLAAKSFQRQALNFTAIHRDTAVISIWFLDSDMDLKLSIKVLRLLVEKMKSEQIHHLICVHAYVLSTRIRQLIADINDSSDLHIEVFSDSEVFVDITKHELVSPHRIMSEIETMKLLKHYKTEKRYLPRIKRNDPMARYMGANAGEVIEIKRPSESCGISLYYRVTVI